MFFKSTSLTLLSLIVFLFCSPAFAGNYYEDRAAARDAGRNLYYAEKEIESRANSEYSSPSSDGDMTCCCVVVLIIIGAPIAAVIAGNRQEHFARQKAKDEEEQRKEAIKIREQLHKDGHQHIFIDFFREKYNSSNTWANNTYVLNSLKAKDVNVTYEILEIILVMERSDYSKKLKAAKENENTSPKETKADSSVSDEIEKLFTLKEKGALTDSEFNEQKDKLLNIRDESTDIVHRKLAEEGALNIKHGKYQEAISVFTKLIFNEYDIGQSYYARAVAYSKVSETDKAFYDLKQADSYGNPKATEYLAKISQKKA